jgi:hypothetical protein
MANTKTNHIKETIFLSQETGTENKKAHHFLRQDKHRAPRDRVASPQPASHTKVMRSQQMSKSVARVQNRPAPKRQTVPVTIWVKPIEKEDLERVASLEKISLSQAGRTLMRKGMQTSVEMCATPHFWSRSSSASLPDISITATPASSPSLYVSPLTRDRPEAIVTNILGLQPDITPDLLRDILSESDKRSKSNITRKTPQITELTEALEKWFFEANKKDREEPRS